MKLAADRWLGVFLIGLAAFVAVQALRLEVPFSYDPVGPKAFPLGLAILLAALSLVLVFKPGANGHWPDRALAVKLLAVLGVLLVYALLFTRLGFVATSLLAIVALARIFAASWGKALLTGVLMAMGSYFLFTHGLGISLPNGYWLEGLI
ncbi:tricarboxylic transport membrane protein [Litchfieldella anticariensis FP35 = DSM 16096]|uniref:Tricarboxylic transport membrane protein n=1 Tax=Litchfieldella anticariensis (strain DSM 16096 / CECT 5854 / CIP 108499 / LMG 22089 / FP35) TaxID=1121939 RepID=S2KQK9_LITA3|nr:tripartite tricarboxylate transporter TctB family protein [Halomonas anticariensis]EPC02763.1 tricarboxylic transport membrane protein [Halomonas anticariensis FP35 = DSM 16096]